MMLIISVHQNWPKNMDYKAIYRRQPEKFLDSQPQAVRHRIMHAVSKLPNKGDISPLEGRSGFRLRVGSFRILFLIDHAKNIVDVVAIGNRGDIYK